MNNIVIGIPTYKRPAMLENLILSIIKCNINKTLIKDVNIIVIDNDIDKTAEIIVKGLTDIVNNTCKLDYYNCPVKGLANVRNELFKKALEYNPDYIVSIDDDEFPSADWLNQLLSVITTIKADIVLGPVIPVFKNDVPSYISYWFHNKKHVNYQRVSYFRAGNFIINVSFLLKHKVKFDDRFNSTGSEDSYYGFTAIKLGAKINWASNAIVYETIPVNRAKLKWLITRRYSGTNAFVYILKIEKNYMGLLKKILINILYLFSGTIALVIFPFPLRWKYWGILKISESIGGFGGLFGILFHEYRKDRC
jgi:succinoglycan biosynthesis protein ExoM